MARGSCYEHREHDALTAQHPRIISDAAFPEIRSKVLRFVVDPYCIRPNCAPIHTERQQGHRDSRRMTERICQRFRLSQSDVSEGIRAWYRFHGAILRQSGIYLYIHLRPTRSVRVLRTLDAGTNLVRPGHQRRLTAPTRKGRRRMDFAGILVPMYGSGRTWFNLPRRGPIVEYDRATALSGKPKTALCRRKPRAKFSTQYKTIMRLIATDLKPSTAPNGALSNHKVLVRSGLRAAALTSRKLNTGYKLQ